VKRFEQMRGMMSMLGQQSGLLGKVPGMGKLGGGMGGMPGMPGMAGAGGVGFDPMALMGGDAGPSSRPRSKGAEAARKKKRQQSKKSRQKRRKK
jgi:signal recognition particle subunit SRP54